MTAFHVDVKQAQLLKNHEKIVPVLLS